MGVGVDLVENSRMQNLIGRWGARFKRKIFQPGEIAYCDTKPAPYRHYAGRFAVKEAVSKAFGTGVGPHIGWLDMEVVRDRETGAPSVKLTGKGQAMARSTGVESILVSLSHTRRYSVAHAVLVGCADNRQ